MNLSVRLFLFALLALLPVFAVVWMLERELQSERQQEVRDLVVRQTQQANSEIARLVEGHRTLLTAITSAPSVLEMEEDRCSRYLGSLAENLPHLNAILVLDLSGTPRCTDDPGRGIANYGDRPYFRAALDSGRFVVGQYTVGRVDTSSRTLPMAAPIRDAGGEILGVAVVGLRLSHLQSIVGSFGLPEDGSLTIADRNGTIIARTPLPDRFVGTAIPPEFVSRWVQAAAPGVEEVLSQDGTWRVIAYQPATLTPEGLYVSSGYSRDEAFNAVNRNWLWNVAVLVAGLLGAVATSWVAARTLIHRPVDDLVSLARAWSQGEAPNVKRPIPTTEFETVAASLDSMGQAIEERSRAASRQRASAEKQAAEREAILGHLAEGVIVTDEAGRITYVNDSAARLHGVSRLDVAPDDYSETYHLFTEDGRPFPPQDLPLARAVRGETVPETRWRIRRPDGSEVLAIGSAGPVMSGNGERLGAVLTLRDDTEREAGERLLLENEARLRALTDNPSSGMVYQLTTGRDGSERRFLYVSQSHEKLTGVPAEAVLADPSLPYMMIVPEHRPAMVEAEAAAIRDLAPFDVEVQFRRVDGEVRWCRILSAPRSQEDGSLIWDGIQIDVTDQKDAEAHLHLLVNELNHRVKNSLATVQAIAAQTFRGPVSMEDAKTEFSGRLRALAHAHDILTEKNWSEATLRDVIERTVGPHHGGSGPRFRVEGPPVSLQPKSALALSMAFHELCTNAVKYGALSTDAGTVAIEWIVEDLPDGRRLDLTWSEHGGPPVTRPVRTGFGSRLIEYGLAAELGGEVRIAYQPEGVTCVVQAPLPTA